MESVAQVNTGTASAVTESLWRRWIIALTVSAAAVLEIIDTSIVNVALPHIQGNLGATLSEVGWVITGYSVANAIVIPLTAWLSSSFGKKGYFIFSLIGFTLASLLCGLADSLPLLVTARVIQGLCGGGLLAKAQAILFETFPPEEQAAAQGLFGVGVMVGPVLGPTLGGYLTDTFDWRMIFFINLPLGMLAILLAWLFLPLDQAGRRSNTVDWLGISLLVVAVGSLQVVLEEGQQEDWFSSRAIVSLSLAAIVGGVLFVLRELKASAPAVDLRVLRHKSLTAGSLYSLVLGMGLYGATFAVPIFAQNILHYTAAQTGFLMVPGAIASALMMPLFARLGGKVDARLMIAGGAGLNILAMLQLSTMNPNTSVDSLFWPLILRSVGSIFMFMPLSTASIGPLPKAEIGTATGFYNLSRQLGGSIGVAALTTILDQRQNFHRAILSEDINPYNPAYNGYLHQVSGLFLPRGGDNSAAQQGAMKLIDSVLNTQASILSFADTFWVVAMVFLVSLPLLLFLNNGKNASAANAAH